MPADVSVVVPTRGDSAHLRHALRSALRCPECAEVLLVAPDGALDPAVLADPRVRPVARPGPGVSAARNAGIDGARGRYIAFLDDDDAWLPDHLERTLDLARRHPEAALFACNAWRFDDRTPGATLPPPESTEGLALFRPGLRAGELTLRQLLLDNPITTPSVVLVREALRPSDRFDDALTHMEDYDLWLRLARDRRLVVDARASVLVRRRPGSASGEWGRMAEGSLVVLSRFLAAGLPPGTLSRRELRARTGGLWHDLAYARLIDDDLGGAREALARAIPLRPARVKNYAYLLASLLPRSLRHALLARGRAARDLSRRHRPDRAITS